MPSAHPHAFSLSHGNALGPFGIPMPDEAAFALERILKSLGSSRRPSPRRCSLAASAPLPCQRADISWITEESIDRMGDIVLAGGMDDSLYGKNPVVTYNHRYDLPPAGLSVWREHADEGAMRGVRAKTIYPSRPATLAAAEGWMPDPVFALVQAGLLAGKSIGFLPLQSREPSREELQRNPRLKNARLVIEQWLLLEYACCAFPAQPNALVEQVASPEGNEFPVLSPYPD
ncbi:MAG: hypothetical protein EXR99_08665 [Gemmataceae bacterium]|nr:hypothetical protein [Gemmataceae bacterium]